MDMPLLPVLLIWVVCWFVTFWYVYKYIIKKRSPNGDLNLGDYKSRFL